MQKTKRVHFFTAFTSLTAILFASCQSNYSVTPSQPTEAALVANSFENGLSTELDINYQKAYANLKKAYGRCIAFTADHEFVFTDNRYEPHLEMGTLFARSEDGVYLHKATIEGIEDNKTRFTLFLPANYSFAKSRFKQDVKRVLGQDTECNI